jgi:hypothetical protein
MMQGGQQQQAEPGYTKSANACVPAYFECDTARKEICVIGLSSMSAMVKMRARAVKMTREMHETTTWIMCGGVKQSARRGAAGEQGSRVSNMCGGVKQSAQRGALSSSSRGAGLAICAVHAQNTDERPRLLASKPLVHINKTYTLLGTRGCRTGWFQESTANTRERGE